MARNAFLVCGIVSSVLYLAAIDVLAPIVSAPYMKKYSTVAFI